MTKADPPNWGSDDLSDFIKTAYENSFATFVNLKPQYKQLEEIDKTYRLIIDNLNNTKDWFAGFFLLRAHSSFLGGVRLSISSQAPEAFMVLRGCLENALYGLYLSRHKESQEIWLRRHDDEKSLKKVKNEFRIRALLDFLKEEDISTYQVANMLYERTIDFGAHPNEKALSSGLKVTGDQAYVQFEINYLIGNSPVMHHCIKTNALIGVCTLDIFRNVYQERYDILGITDKLKKLKNDL